MKPRHPQSKWCLTAKFLSALVAASLATFSAGATTVVGWGDSLTYGTGGIAATGEIRSWPWWFTQISGGLTVINKGVGGETVGMIKTRMLAEPDLHDHFTVIWAGRNNVGGFGTNMSYAEADIAEMVAALPPTTEYLVLGVTNSDSEPSGSTNLNNINLFNSHLAATYGPRFLDIRSILVESYDPSLPQDVINHAGDMPPASLLSDGLHLNPAGYEVVGAAIYKAFLGLAAPERGTWTGEGGTNNWKNSANWSVGPYSGDTAGFSSTETAFFVTAGGGIIDLSGTVNVHTLAFGSRGEGAGAFMIGTSGDALNLTSGGGVSVGSLVSVDETVGNSAGTINLSGTANSTALFSNNGRSILTVASPVHSTQAAGNTSTLTLGGRGDGIITGSIHGGGAAGSGALSIVKTGTGTWTLSGQSSAAGTVAVLGGELVIDGATNGTLLSPVGISNGEAVFRGSSSSATSVSLPNLAMGVRSATANTLTLASNGGAGVDLSVGSYSNATSTIFSNLIDLSSSPGNSVVIGSLGAGAFRPLSSGVLMSGAGSGSARAVTIVRDDVGYGFATISSATNGALGRLTTGTALGASNASATADYRLDGVGTLVRSANLVFSTLTIDSSAGDIVLDMGAFNLNPTSYGSGALIAGNHNVSINGGGITTPRFYNYSTGTFSLSLASTTLLFIGGTGFTDYSGTIAPSTAGGVGTVVAQGIVRISRDQDLAVTTPTKFLVTGGGVLEIGADLNGEAAGDFSYGINTSNFTKVVRFYGNSGLSASGGDRVVNFNGNSIPKTYTWGSGHFLTDADGATDGGFTFKLSSEKSDSTIEIQNPLVLGTNTTRCVDVANGSAAIDAVLSGELRGTGASLIKNGEGTLSLRAKNIYSGATVINAGCLFIEGALSYTSAIDVAPGAEVIVDGEVNLNCTTSVRGILGGSGMMGTVVIESGGILTPGDLIAPLTAGSVSFATGGVFSMEVEGAAPGTSHQLSVVGNLNITNAALNLTVPTPLNDPVYILATYGSLTGTFANVTGLPAGYILDYAYDGDTQIALVADGPTAPLERVLFEDDFSGGMTQWKRVGSATKPIITTNDTAPLSGNVMLSSYAKVATVAYFPSVTLQNPGDYIMVRCHLLYTAKQSTNTTGPTLALYNSQGTQLMADHTGAADGTLPASLTDDRGYKAYKSFETANDLVLFKNHLGFAPLRFGTLNPSLHTVSTGTGIALNSVHTLLLKIELAANGDDLLITSSFNGSTQTRTATGADVLTKSFNEIGVNLWGGDFSGAGLLDNVAVFTNVNIPAGAAALGYTQVAIDERPKLANFTETNAVLTILRQADGTTNSLVGAPHDFAGGALPGSRTRTVSTSSSMSGSRPTTPTTGPQSG